MNTPTNQPPHAPENQPCCAHTKVVLAIKNHSDGTCSDYWKCNDCGRLFVPAPIPHPTASTTRPDSILDHMPPPSGYTPKPPHRITSENPPQFPCWLFSPGYYYSVGWRRAESANALIHLNKFTHWHPDQPTAPTVVTEASGETPRTEMGESTASTLDDPRRVPVESGPAVAHASTTARPASVMDALTEETERLGLYDTPHAAGETPRTDAVAKSIGSLACQWKTGSIDAVQFEQSAQAELNKLGQLARELNAAKAELLRWQENFCPEGSVTGDASQTGFKDAWRVWNRCRNERDALRAENARLSILLDDEQKAEERASQAATTLSSLLLKEAISDAQRGMKWKEATAIAENLWKQNAELRKDKERLELIRAILADAREINILNYSEDDVVALNAALITIHRAAIAKLRAIGEGRSGRREQQSARHSPS